MTIRRCLSPRTGRPAGLLALALAATLAAHASGQVEQAPDAMRALVDGRKVSDVVFQGVPWTPKTGGIEGAGPGNAIFCAEFIGAGDFAVQAKVSLSALGTLWSAFQIGESFFGFDGDKKTLYVNGPLFGGASKSLGASEPRLKAGKPFDFSVRRTGATLAIAIDGATVFETDVGQEPLGRFGFVPNSATLTLARWTVEGSLAPPQAAPGVRELQPAIDAAIDRAVLALLTMQQRDGSWGSQQVCFPGGQTGLCVYMLIKAGLAPTHPAVVRALRYLESVEPEGTYAAGLMLMAWGVSGDPKAKERMKPIVQKLLEWQIGGWWGYPRQGTGNWEGWSNSLSDPDLSNTQYAVLGLRAAAHAGIDIPPKVWSDMADVVLRLQEEPRSVGVVVTGKTGSGKRTIAGFRYHQDSAVTGTMTAAGVSCLAIAREQLGSRLIGENAARVVRAMQNGVNWLDYYFTPDKVPFGDEPWIYYWIYGIERVGSLLELESFGDHEWYPEGARSLLKRQSGEGTWASNAGAPTRAVESDTCWAVLFLKRATRVAPRTGADDKKLFQPVDDPDEVVRLRHSGVGRISLWIGGFGPAAVKQYGGALGALRVARVEYWVDGELRATVPGDPAVAWKDQSFPAKLDFLYPGVYKIVAKAALVAPDAPADARDATIVVESKPLALRCEGGTEPWLTACTDARFRNILIGAPMAITTTSVNGGDVGQKAFDGVESTRWMCNNDDAQPGITIEFGKGVRGSTLILNSHCTSPGMRGKHDVIRRVSVRINRGKETIDVPADPDELKPIVIPLPKSTAIQRLEIRITEREKGTTWPGFAGFTEIAIEK